MPNKKKQYREMDDSGLNNVLSELNTEYFNLKFQAALTKLENTSLVRLKRRDIARVKTLLHERTNKAKVDS